MTETEAETVLDVKRSVDPETLVDAYERQCFPVKDYLLKHPVVPPVVRKRAEKLKRIHEAFGLLSGEKEEVNPAVEVFLPLNEAYQVLPGSGILEVVRNYEKAMMQEKLQLANASKVPAILDGMKKVAQIQNAYHAIWDDNFGELVKMELPVPYNKEVKIREQVDSAKLIAVLKKESPLGEKMGKALKDAVLECVEAGEVATLEPLFTEALRVRNYLKQCRPQDR